MKVEELNTNKTLKFCDITEEDVSRFRTERKSFGINYLYIDNDTRIRYGGSFDHLGKVYKLQRKKIFWISYAWTYASTQTGRSIVEIINYLFWYEGDKHKCKF